MAASTTALPEGSAAATATAAVAAVAASRGEDALQRLRLDEASTLSPAAAAARDARGEAAFAAEQQLQQRWQCFKPLLLALAVVALLAGEIGGAQRGGGSGLLRAAGGAAAAAPAAQPMRVLEVSMASLVQARDAELFVIDCFRRPVTNTAGVDVAVCLLKGQGRLQAAFAPGALAWSCTVEGDHEAEGAVAPVPALRAYSSPASLVDRGTGIGLFPVHIVECALAPRFAGAPVRVSITVVRAVGGASDGLAAAAAPRVPVPLPPPPIHAVSSGGGSSSSRGGVFLAGVICISDVFWDMAREFNVQFDGMVVATTLSVQFHLAAGLEHMSVFLDLRAPEPFLAEFALTLRREVARGQVTFVRARIAGARRDLETQEMLINVALWWWKTQAEWLAIFDVDEYLQPGGGMGGGVGFPAGGDTVTVAGMLRAYVERVDAARRNGTGPPTIMVRSQFWWGAEDWTTDIPSLRMRPDGDYLSESTRTKCIYATADVLAASVHLPLAPLERVVPPLNVLRLNHFKFFGGNRVQGPPELDDSFAETWFALGLPPTACASRARPRCDRTNATTTWAGPAP